MSITARTCNSIWIQKLERISTFPKCVKDWGRRRESEKRCWPSWTWKINWEYRKRKWEKRERLPRVRSSYLRVTPLRGLNNNQKPSIKDRSKPRWRTQIKSLLSLRKRSYPVPKSRCIVWPRGAGTTRLSGMPRRSCRPQTGILRRPSRWTRWAAVSQRFEVNTSPWTAGCPTRAGTIWGYRKPIRWWRKIRSRRCIIPRTHSKTP